MLKIREAQVRDLEKARRESFGATLIDLLQAHLPKARQVTRDELMAEMQPVIAQARDYGLTSEQEVAMYVLVAAHLGGNFTAAAPRAAQMLADPHLSNDLKLVLLRGLMLAAVARTAA
jgi:hypothetical protein